MRLYPKVIPVISRETIQLLMQDGDIEVEPMTVATSAIRAGREIGRVTP